MMVIILLLGRWFIDVSVEEGLVVAAEGCEGVVPHFDVVTLYEVEPYVACEVYRSLRQRLQVLPTGSCRTHDPLAGHRAGCA